MAELGEATYRLKLDRKQLLDGLAKAQAETTKASDKIQNSLNKTAVATRGVDLSGAAAVQSIGLLSQILGVLGVRFGALSGIIISTISLLESLNLSFKKAGAIFTGFVAPAAAVAAALGLIASIVLPRQVLEFFGFGKSAKAELDARLKFAESIDAKQKAQVRNLQKQIDLASGLKTKFDFMPPVIAKMTKELEKVQAQNERNNKAEQRQLATLDAEAARVTELRNRLRELQGLGPILGFTKSDREKALEADIAEAEAVKKTRDALREQNAEREKAVRLAAKQRDAAILARRAARGEADAFAPAVAAVGRLNTAIGGIVKERQLRAFIGGAFGEDAGLKGDALKALGLGPKSIDQSRFGSIATSALAGGKGLVGSAKKSDEALSLNKLVKIVGRMESVLADFDGGLS